MDKMTAGISNDSVIDKKVFPLPLNRANDRHFRCYCRWCGNRLRVPVRRYCSVDCEKSWSNKIEAERAESQKAKLEAKLENDFFYQKEIALDRDGRKCQSCGISEEESEIKYGQKLHAHHVKWKYYGGSNHHTNLIATCKYCHRHVFHAPGELAKQIGIMSGEDE